jgi:hypothetical protein
MNRFRFQLRTLLVVTALSALLIGLYQLRRHALSREIVSLRSQGFTVAWNDHWTGTLWPSVRPEASFEFLEGPDGEVKIGSKVYTEQAAIALYEQASDRLFELGVKEVRLDEGGKPGDTFTAINPLLRD